MMRSGLLFLIFLLALLNWIGSSIAAKSAMHETTAAVAGLSSLVALAGSLICDALREITQAAAKHAEAERAILLQIQQAIEKQNDILGTQTEILATNGAVAQRVRGESAAHLLKLGTSAEYTNALLKWIGEKKGPTPES